VAVPAGVVMRERPVVRLAPGCVSRFPGRWCRRTSSYWYNGTIDQHPVAGSAAQILANGTPEGITGRGEAQALWR
jgi:hypothetical protein